MPRPPRGGGYLSPPYSGPLPKVPRGPAPGEPHHHGGTMTTTAPDRQPSTPGQALRETVAYLVDRAVAVGARNLAASLKVADEILCQVRAAELDAAPTTYTMPEAPPPGTTAVWEDSPGGGEWQRHYNGIWRAVDGPLVDDCSGAHPWSDLLAYHAPLSTVPHPSGRRPAMPELITEAGGPGPDLLRCLAVRDQQRADQVAARLARLGDRERALVREAAVMGYVLGHMAGEVAGRRGDLPDERRIPPDSRIVAEVLLGCAAQSDLYPLIGEHVEADDAE